MSSKSYFCILETNSLSAVSLAILFSHAEGHLFILLTVSLAVQKLLSLIKSHLFTFFVCFHYSKGWVKKDLAVVYVKEDTTYVFL